MLCFSEHLWDSWSTYHAPGTGVSVAHVLIHFAIEQPEGVGVFTIHIYRWQNWGLNIFNSLLKVTLQIIFKARIQTHILLFFMFLNVASQRPYYGYSVGPWALLTDQINRMLPAVHIHSGILLSHMTEWNHIKGRHTEKDKYTMPLTGGI